MSHVSTETKVKPMSKRLRAKWVKALRSGLYPKGTGQLRKTRDGKHSYCCLGVLCEITGAEFIDDGGDAIYSDTRGSPNNYLPTAFGIAMKQQEILAAKNDGGTSFAKIADWIEANL